MHAGTVHACLGLRHEGRVKSVAFRDGPDRCFHRHDLVRGFQRVIHTKFYFMLAGSDLMSRGLHLIAHLFQRQHDIPPGIFPQIHRT